MEGNKDKKKSGSLKTKSVEVAKGKPATKRWDNKETNYRIDLLEERPCLWDVNDKTYHMREKRERSYKEIEEKLQISVADVKSKVMSLRSQLGRDMAKVSKTKSGQSTNELYKHSWVFWDRHC